MCENLANALRFYVECLPQDAAVRFKIKAHVETFHMRTPRQAGTNESRHMGSSVFNIWFTHGCTLVFNGDIYCGLNEIKRCYGTPSAWDFKSGFKPRKHVILVAGVFMVWQV